MTDLTKMLCGLFFFTLILSACSSEDLAPTSNEDEIVPQEFLNISYMGQSYENVPTAYDENGDFIFLDKEFSEIYQKNLANDLDWSISIKGSNSIEFFSNLKENLEANGIVIDSTIKSIAAYPIDGLTRAGYDDLASLTLFDDKEFKDRNYTFVLNDSVISTEVSNLKNSPWSFNDKCSSLKIANNMPNDPNKEFQLGYFSYPCSNIDAVFIGYDDRNFSDRTITCVAHAGDKKECSNLPGFNDKLSSFKFFFAQKGQYTSSF